MLIYYDRPCLASEGCDLVLSRMPDIHWFDLLALSPLSKVICVAHVMLFCCWHCRKYLTISCVLWLVVMICHIHDNIHCWQACFHSWCSLQISGFVHNCLCTQLQHGQPRNAIAWKLDAFPGCWVACLHWSCCTRYCCLSVPALRLRSCHSNDAMYFECPYLHVCQRASAMANFVLRTDASMTVGLYCWSL